jgi:hypothetical protein
MGMKAIFDQREALLGARFRFSPETQSVREGAVDRIVMQVLVVEGSALPMPRLEARVLRLIGGRGAIGLPDLRRSTLRLTKSGDLEAEGHGLEGRTYALSDRAKTEYESIRRSSQSRYDRVVARLFKNMPGGPGRYHRPFVSCLQLLFSKVADIYVRLLLGEVAQEEFVTGVAVREALAAVNAEYSGLDQASLARGVYTFLTEIDPEFDEIKFNMTQNYYVARTLGLDNASELLSREVFGRAILYLDTNVFFHALDVRAKLYRNFQALSTACRQLGISLRVCQISIDEHRNVVAYHRDLVKQVEDQVPEGSEDKVESLFFHAYRDEQRADPDTDIDKVFQRFMATGEELSKQHNVELVDDKWFDENKDASETRILIKAMQKQYSVLRPGRIKRERAACHDALLVRWVERERGLEQDPVWLITVDASLPAFFPDKGTGDDRPLAISLDALLQWISPLASSAGLEGNMRDIFAESLKHQLLPQDRFLDLTDFMVFAHMEWSCKELPSEDVEAAIQYLRGDAAARDMSKAEDREEVHRRLSRFFADPSRKYKTEMERFEEALHSKDQEIAEIQRRAEEEADRRAALARQEIEEEAVRKASMLESKFTEGLDERDGKIEKLQASLSQLQQDQEAREQADLRRSAWWRVVAVVLVLLVMESIALWLGLRWSKSEVILPLLKDIWFLLLIPLGGIFFLGSWVIGETRMKILPWGVRKVLFRTD